MGFVGDVVEWLICEDWSRRWVLLRFLVLMVLVLFFRETFVHLFDWFVNWKAGQVTHDLQHILRPALSPTPAPTP